MPTSYNVQLVTCMPCESSDTIEEMACYSSQVLTLILQEIQNTKAILIDFAQVLPGSPLYEHVHTTGKIYAYTDPLGVFGM